MSFGIIHEPLTLPRPAARRAGQAALVLVGLLFGAAGCYFGREAGAWGGPSCPERALAVLLSGAAVLSAGISALLLGLALWVGRRGAALEARRARHPDSPWMWRDDWAAGRIGCSSRRQLATTWGFTLVWNALSAPLVWLVLLEAERTGNRTLLWALLFPALGLGFVAWALFASARFLRYGTSRFDMERVPGAVGRRLEGVVRARIQRPPDAGMRLVLTCVRKRRVGRGKRATPPESILWQDEMVIPPALMRTAPVGIEVPVSFAVPAQAPPAAGPGPLGSVHWILRVEAQGPGLRYRAHFEVPVFRVAGAPLDASPGAARSAGEGALHRRGGGFGAGIRLGPAPAGGTEVYFAPCRAPEVVRGAGAFLARWIGGIILMVRLGAPEIFPLGCALAGLFILAGLVELALGVTRVVIAGEEVRVRRSWLGIGGTRVLARAEITDVRVEISLQYGGAGGTAYHDVVLCLGSGRRVTAGRFVRSRRDAEWLAREMSRLIGVDEAARPAHGESLEPV